MSLYRQVRLTGIIGPVRQHSLELEDMAYHTGQLEGLWIIHASRAASAGELFALHRGSAYVSGDESTDRPHSSDATVSRR